MPEISNEATLERIRVKAKYNGLYYLQYTIDRIESNRCPRSQSLCRIVFVMETMNVLKEKFIRMESAMNPIDSEFYQYNIYY